MSSGFVLGDDFARVLTETTQALVCVLDADGRILLFNDACERSTGFSREEVIGRDARDFVIPHEEAEAFGDVLAYIWRTSLSSPQVGHWVTKDGGRRLIAWSNKLLPSVDGGASYLVTTGIDLTENTTQTEGAFAGDENRRCDRGAKAGFAHPLRDVGVDCEVVVDPRREPAVARSADRGVVVGEDAHADLEDGLVVTVVPSDHRRGVVAFVPEDGRRGHVQEPGRFLRHRREYSLRRRLGRDERGDAA